MKAKKQAPKRSTSHLAKKKPTAKKTIKKLSALTVKPKRKQSATTAKKSKVVAKKRVGQQSVIAKKKIATKVASKNKITKSKATPTPKVRTKKITPRKQSTHSLRNTIESEVQRALQMSVLPLIQNLIFERSKPEKTIQTSSLTAVVGDDSLVNLLIVSVSKLQDTIERFSTSLEQKLIQAKPAEVKPAEVKPTPPPQAQAPAAPPTVWRASSHCPGRGRCRNPATARAPAPAPAPPARW